MERCKRAAILWDKPRNLELLLKYLGIIKDRVEVEGDWDKWAARLASARNREPSG